MWTRYAATKCLEVESISTNLENNKIINLKIGEDKCIYYKDKVTDAEVVYYPLTNSFVFRSSNSKLDWDHNYEFRPIKFGDFMYHLGFFKQFKKLYPFVNKHRDYEKPVNFFGHSLGGALAQIFTVECTEEPESKDYEDKLIFNRKINLVTFGAPRAIFGKRCKSKDILESVAYFYENDPITFLPPLPFHHNEEHRVILTKDHKNDYHYHCETTNIFTKLRYYFKRYNFFRMAKELIKNRDLGTHHEMKLYYKLTKDSIF